MALPTEEQILELAIILAEANGMAWGDMQDGHGAGELGRAVASRAFYRRLAKTALMHTNALSKPPDRATAMPDNDQLVTPEMIRAGVDILHELEGEASKERLATEVYRAMRMAAPGSLLASSSS